MSELRDLTAAMASFSSSLASIEECLCQVQVNGTQHRDGLHKLRSTLQQWSGEREEGEMALKQIQEFMGALTHRQMELHDSMENLRSTVQSHQKHVNERIRELEGEERTQS